MAKHPFEYHKPTQEEVAHMGVINELCRATYDAVMEHAPMSAERTIAIRKLQEVRMWANAAIVLNEYAVHQSGTTGS